MHIWFNSIIFFGQVLHSKETFNRLSKLQKHMFFNKPSLALQKKQETYFCIKMFRKAIYTHANFDNSNANGKMYNLRHFLLKCVSLDCGE